MDCSADMRPIIQQSLQHGKHNARRFSSILLAGLAHSCCSILLLCIVLFSIYGFPRLLAMNAGMANGQQLPESQYPEIEGLLQLVNATLHPIPMAGHDFFNTIILTDFGEHSLLCLCKRSVGRWGAWCSARNTLLTPLAQAPHSANRRLGPIWLHNQLAGCGRFQPFL